MRTMSRLFYTYYLADEKRNIQLKLTRLKYIYLTASEKTRLTTDEQEEISNMLVQKKEVNFAKDFVVIDRFSCSKSV